MYQFLNKPRPTWIHLLVAVALVWVGMCLGSSKKSRRR